MSAFRVLITDAVAEAGIELLKTECEVVYRPGMAPDVLENTIGDFDALIVRSGTKVTSAVLERGEKLKVIGRAGVGVDNIDVEMATQRGVLVINVPGGNTIAAAEHTWALLMSVARNIPAADRSLREGRWDRKLFTGTQLRGKVLGVVGLGRIGSEVARRAHGFELEVLGYDPYVSEQAAERMGITMTPLDDLLSRADFVTVHVPLNGETRGLIGLDEFRLMRPEAFVVNCARGGIIDEQALAQALEEGMIQGAALDVYEHEPPAVDGPLVQSGHTVLTPHLGASTHEAQVYNSQYVAEQVLRALRGQVVASPVNLPKLPPEEWAQLSPFMPLLELMGSFLVQAVPPPLAELHVTYAGELANHQSELLTSALLKGVLQPISAEPVNYVNAPEFARKRGMQVVESRRREVSGYQSMVTLNATVGDVERTISGTVSVFGEPILVSIDGMPVDLRPAELLLLLKPRDEPGMIGYIGTRLGEHNINIGGIQLGRPVEGGQFVMVLQLDNDISPELLEELARHPAIAEARKVRLPRSLVSRAKTIQTRV